LRERSGGGGSADARVGGQQRLSTLVRDEGEGGREEDEGEVAGVQYEKESKDVGGGGDGGEITGGGAGDDEDDEYDSTVDWDDFDFDDVDIVDTDYKVTTSEGVEHIFTLDEVLSVQGRLKRRFAARKNKQKLRVARNIALRRGSSPARLKKRATRGARNMVYKRLLKGRDKSSMPPAEKARFERLIGMYQPLIQRFAQRMLPQMRKMEITRMKNRSGKKPQKSKKYKVAKPVRSGTTQKAKKFKVKKR